MNRLPRAVLILTITAFTLAGAGLLATAQPKHRAKLSKGFVPVMSIEKMMEGQKKLYGEIGDGILDQAWEEAETAAWLLAEIANVNHYQNSDPQYRGFADRMSSDCVALAKTLAKHDANAAKAARSKVGRNCKACHEVFRKE